MTDGLKDEHRAAIIAAIAANDRVERAVLFGSRATGTNTVSSDVDIALFGEQLTLIDHARLAAVLDEIPIAQSVDLLLYDSIQAGKLREHIRRRGVELYTRPSLQPARHRTGPATSTCAVMPNDAETSSCWRRHDVSDLIRHGYLAVGDGYRAKNNELARTGLPFARAGNVADRFRFSGADRFPEDRLHRVGDKLSRHGDVVFTSKGTVGRFSFVRQETEQFVYSPQLCYWRSLDREVIDPHFLYCWMRSPEFFRQFRSVAGKTDMADYVSLTDQRHMFITLPPVAEQRTIVHVLGALDDKIELNRSMSATLEAMVLELFKSWFVHFDPVRTKLEGRDTCLPEHVAALFPSRLVESEIGEVPTGWDVISLSHIMDVNPTRRLRKGQRAPYLGMANMPTTGHTPHGVIDRPFGSGMRFTNGDTLVARITPCLENGKTAYVDFLQPGAIGWGSTEYLVMRPKPPLPTQFAYCLARSAHFRAFLISNMSGTSGRQRVSAPALSHFMCINPPDCIAHAFEKVVQPAMRRASVAARESRRLATIRDSLLPRLLGGELRINRFMEETA